MKWLLYILDTISFIWAIVGYGIILFTSVFLFDSPDSTMLGAWTMIMIASLLVNAIPLFWWLYRISNGGWFKKRKARVIFWCVVAILWCVIPFIFWYFPLY